MDDKSELDVDEATEVENEGRATGLSATGFPTSNALSDSRLLPLGVPDAGNKDGDPLVNPVVSFVFDVGDDFGPARRI